VPPKVVSEFGVCKTFCLQIEEHVHVLLRHFARQMRNKKSGREILDITVVQSTSSSTPTVAHSISADDESSVVGVTSVDNRLFVLRLPSEQRIQVYDLRTFTLQQTLEVAGLNDGNGLTACVIDKCLYVSGNRSATVYKIQLTVDNEIIKWSVGRGPQGLSMNIACNLLVACNVDNKIQEYNSSGSLVREIRLMTDDDHLLNPLHVIQLTSERYVIGCPVEGRECDVVEVDANGRVVVSYKTQLQSTNRKRFSAPCHLAVDKNNECILVADCNNDRIVILSRSLNHCARQFNVTSVDGGLQQPTCLHFNESEGRLFVGELSGQRRVLVFDNVVDIANSS
jgi:DNA-binding beta-propeller fold protein YncE